MKYLLFLTLCLSFCSDIKARNNALAFIENKNQWEPVVKYKANLPGGAIFVTDAGFTYSFYNAKEWSDAQQRNKKHQTQLKDSQNLKSHLIPDSKNSVVHGHAYRVNFLNANLNSPNYTAQEERTEYYNFFLGKDQSHWAGKVHGFNVINRSNLYDGIDLKIYSEGNGSMKYDFIIAPHADPSKIILNFDGVRPQLASNGNLEIKTSVNEISEGKPVSYQIINGEKKWVESRYKMLPDGNVMFEFPKGYNTNAALIIDPSLVFSSYAGGTPASIGWCSSYDKNDALFLGAAVQNVGWPVTTGAFQIIPGSTTGPANPVTGALTGASDIGINKYSPDGSTLLYSTYFGGAGGEVPFDLMVNSNNELVITGITWSLNMPTTNGCFDNTMNGRSDFFVAHFNEDGTSLLGSTYVGGWSDEGLEVAGIGALTIDASNNIIVCGTTYSPDFPVTANAAQPASNNMNIGTPGVLSDGAVFKLSPNCSQLLYSTFLSGSIWDYCTGVGLTTDGNIMVCGSTNSEDFYTSANALNTSFIGGSYPGDAFVTVISATSGQIIASSFIGSNVDDRALKLDTDAQGNILVLGNTWGFGNIPISPNTFNIPNGDVFLQRLSPDLSTLVQSTLLGRDNAAFGGGVTVSLHAFKNGVCGNNCTYLCASSGDFPAFGDISAMPVTTNAYDADASLGYYFCVLDQHWQNLVYGSYINGNVTVNPGSSHFAPQGTLFQFGQTDGSGAAAFPPVPAPAMPTTPGSFAPNYTQTQYPGGSEAFAFKFEILLPETFQHPVITADDTFVCNDDPITLSASATVSDNRYPTTYQWQPPAAILTASNQPTVTVDPSISNDFIVTVTNGFCGSSTDTVHVEKSGVLNAAIIPGDTSICTGDTVHLIASGGNIYTWEMMDNMTTNNETAIVWPIKNTTYAVTVRDDHNCEKTITANVDIAPPPHVDAGPDKYIAYGASTHLNGDATGNVLWEYNVKDAHNLQPEVSPKETTTYYLTTSNTGGCKATDSVKVYVVSTGFPNAFSPNGDNLNDEFKIFFNIDGNVIPISLSIYNRWGEKVFFTDNANKGWDGSYKGKPADMGTYFYNVRYAIGDKEFQRKGDLTLIR